jgi:hypothetical protein
MGRIPPGDPMKNMVHIKPSSPFHSIFPNGLAPVKNILIPEQGTFEGPDGRPLNDAPQDFYRLDVAKLSNEQQMTIAGMVAAQCGGSAADVEAHMLKEGFIPLRAIHVEWVSSDLRAFL